VLQIASCARLRRPSGLCPRPAPRGPDSQSKARLHHRCRINLDALCAVVRFKSSQGLEAVVSSASPSGHVPSCCLARFRARDS